MCNWAATLWGAGSVFARLIWRLGGVLMRTRIKLCGMKTVEDVRLADQLGADAIGLVFYPPSPRAVDPDLARRLSRSASVFCSRVALLVDPDVETVHRILDKVAIDVLQFHGNESPEFCQQFNLPWLKALRVRDGDQLKADLERFSGADTLLLDAYKAGVPGGTGETFQWELIPPLWRQRIVLAGGLTPDNVGEAIKAVLPLGVDVSGGIEASKGVKSPEKMRHFVRHVRMADAERDWP